MAKKKRNIRLWFQAGWFALTNGYAKGFLEGKIYRGATKFACVPGLNCYSCPGALARVRLARCKQYWTAENFAFPVISSAF